MSGVLCRLQRTTATGEIKNSLDFAAGVAEPECDGRDGLRALEIVCSAYK